MIIIKNSDTAEMWQEGNTFQLTFCHWSTCTMKLWDLFFETFSMAPHSSTLAWKIPWMEKSGGLQSMGSLRVGHDWVTSFSLSSIGEGNGNPLQRSCLENPRDGGAWWAAVYGVAQSRTRLKRLSSSSSSSILCIYTRSYMCLQKWNTALCCFVTGLVHIIVYYGIVPVSRWASSASRDFTLSLWRSL